ncbi:hypothetical protein [Blautia sp.]|nr:hypothetical protein [Blautia sp.]
MALRKISDDAGKGFLSTGFDQVIVKVVNSDVKSALAGHNFSGYN